QTPLPPLAGLLGPLLGFAMAFGRWRGLPIAETAIPAGRLLARRLTGKRRWVRPSLIGDNSMAALPVPLRELELLEPAGWPVGVVRDRAAGSVTALVRVHGYGFPLAAGVEQDQMLAGWGAALSPFAREG